MADVEGTAEGWVGVESMAAIDGAAEGWVGEVSGV